MTLRDCLKQECRQTPFSNSIYLHFEMRPARNNGEGRFFPNMSVLLQHILKCSRDVSSNMTQSLSFETGVWVPNEGGFTQGFQLFKVSAKTDIWRQSLRLEGYFFEFQKHFDTQTMQLTRHLNRRKDGVQLQLGLLGQRMDRELGRHLRALQLSHCASVMQPSKWLRKMLLVPFYWDVHVKTCRHITHTG